MKQQKNMLRASFFQGCHISRKQLTWVFLNIAVKIFPMKFVQTLQPKIKLDL